MTALPEALLESELFGHEKGAFTGAVATKMGLFEVADGGTPFIDELGELAGGLQAKLLRVLQDGRIRRVGATKEVQVDVRVIAATNRNLADEVKARRFRDDLFYRLNVIPSSYRRCAIAPTIFPCSSTIFCGDRCPVDGNRPTQRIGRCARTYGQGTSASWPT